LPGAIELNSHCKRSIIGALDIGKNALIHASHTRIVKALRVIEFIEALLQQGNGKPTVIVLDNASIHHNTEQTTLHRWFIEHKMLPLYRQLAQVSDFKWAKPAASAKSGRRQIGPFAPHEPSMTSCTITDVARRRWSAAGKACLKAS